MTIATFDVGPWDTDVKLVDPNHIIEIDKAGTKENIFVLQTHLDPSSDRPVFGSPDEYVLAIQVVREDIREYYKLGKFEKQGDGSYLQTESYSTADLIYVAGESTIPGNDPQDMAGVTVMIDDMDGGNGLSEPVNAIVLGTDKNDTLKYFGDGEAIIVGFQGDDKIRSAPTMGAGAGSQLVAEFVDAAQPLTNDLNVSSEIWDKINATRSDAAPATTKNSLTGSGGADLAIISPGDSATNFSINSTVFTSTPPPPPGGAALGDEPHTLGSLATGSDLAANESYIEIVAGDVAGPAGAIIGGLNHLVLKAAIGTPISTGQLDLSVVSTSHGAALHALGSQIDFTAQGITAVEVGSFGGTLHIGDLSSLGVIPIVVDSLINSAGTATAIDGAPAGMPSNIQIARDYGEQGQLSVTGAGLMPNIEFIGLSQVDSVQLNLFGGTVAIADLVGSGLATLRIDNSGRTVGSNTAAVVTLENKAASVWLTPDAADPNDIRLTSDNEPAVTLGGVRTIDSLTVNLAGSGQQTAFFDASQMKGALNINSVGGAAAVDDVTLANVGTEAVVTVDGGTGQTKLNFGRNYLSEIKHDVTGSNVELHIDNIGAVDGRVMTLTPTTFTGWDAGGGSAPTLFISQLHDTLTVDAGGGDVYLLDGTPSGITNIVLNNKTDTRSRIYSDNWQVPVLAKDDWAVYLGQRILTDGTVQRTKHLAGLSNIAVTLDFQTSSAAATDFVIDGDLDAPGVQYEVGGSGLQIVNETVNLSVAISGYREPDQAYVYIPGGTVDANLHYSGLGKLYFDGQSRLSGTNATASNTITIEARYGQIDMTPLSQYNTFIDMYTDVYILGSMTQDSLYVDQPTNVVMTAAIAHDFQLAAYPRHFICSR